MWTETTAGTSQTPAWDHESNNYQIMLTRWLRPYRLVSFIHEDWEGDYLFWDFATLAEAQAYVEGI